MQVQGNPQITLIGDTMMAVGNRLMEISEYCVRTSTPFNIFMNDAISAKLKQGITIPKESDVKRNYEYVVPNRALKEKITKRSTVDKIRLIFDLFSMSNHCVIKGGALDSYLSTGCYKTQAILHLMKCWGMLEIKKRGWRYPFDLKLTALGVKLERHPSLEHYLYECIKRPFVGIEEREKFWEQRLIGYAAHLGFVPSERKDSKLLAPDPILFDQQCPTGD
jgi:hypothetical protein